MGRGQQQRGRKGRPQSWAGEVQRCVHRVHIRIIPHTFRDVKGKAKTATTLKLGAITVIGTSAPAQLGPRKKARLNNARPEQYRRAINRGREGAGKHTNK